MDKALTTKTTLSTLCPQATHTPKISGLPTSSTDPATTVSAMPLKEE